MQKLKRLISSYLECGGIGFNIPFKSMQELIYISSSVTRHEQPSTTSRDVKRILDECGIHTVEYLGGWKVSHANKAA